MAIRKRSSKPHVIMVTYIAQQSWRKNKHESHQRYLSQTHSNAQRYQFSSLQLWLYYWLWLWIWISSWEINKKMTSEWTHKLTILGLEFTAAATTTAQTYPHGDQPKPRVSNKRKFTLTKYIYRSCINSPNKWTSPGTFFTRKRSCIKSKIGQNTATHQNSTKWRAGMGSGNWQSE
jgi:hypothetical protein